MEIVLKCLNIYTYSSASQACCDGRVVKALDQKSNGIFPRRFEPYSQRNIVFILSCRIFMVISSGQIKLTTMGIEPTIFRFEVGRLIHWATRPRLNKLLYDMYYFLTLYFSTMRNKNIYSQRTSVHKHRVLTTQTIF